MTTAVGVLGCPDRYRARITWRATGQEYAVPELNQTLTSVVWNRTLNDVSSATVTLSKTGMTDACCGAIRGITAWAHELQVYRGDVLVWEGPVKIKRENRAQITIEAEDVVAYLDRIVNTFRVRYVEAVPDGEGRRRGQLAWIARHHIMLNLTREPRRPVDYCRIMDHIVIRDTGGLVKYEKDGSAGSSSDPTAGTIWNQWVGIVALRNLVERGLSFTTIGRTLYLKGGPQPDPNATRPLARLNLQHIVGDVEVVQDGNALGTYAWASDQREPDISEVEENVPSKRVGTGRINTPYGPVELLVNVDEENADAADLLEAARNALTGRYPIPHVISLQAGSALSPEAPITINELVPGERIDISTNGYCTELMQPFRITDVEGTWNEQKEQITASFVPWNALDDLLMRAPTPPDVMPPKELR